ncbi:MAG: LytTR family DNA-binding domain-containing protein [Gammaproteobacteria bacterium]|nr:LytTR family DNA-binding domain-containing protein [Gammaproteobacteria bacterium]
MRVLLVDDEPLARERLRRLLRELEGVKLVGEAGDGKAALSATAALQPDLILLDIRMPGMDGMAVARHLATLPQPPRVIFTTAYGEHALEAFEAQAIDYLVKPVRRERLAQALERAARLLTPPAASIPLAGPAHLTVKKQGRIELLPVEEILYYQADHKYVTAHLAQREALLEESLKQLEELLGERVIRVHRNALVARSAITGLERDSHGVHYATLRDIGRGPEISRRLVAEVRRQLKEMS